MQPILTENSCETGDFNGSGNGNGNVYDLTFQKTQTFLCQ